MTRVHGPTVSCGTGVAQDEEFSPPPWLRVGFGSHCLEWTPHSGSRLMPTRAANFSRKRLEPLGAAEGSLDQGFVERREHLGQGSGPAVPGPTFPVHANEELPRAKRRAEEENFEVLVAGIILRRNSKSAFITAR